MPFKVGDRIRLAEEFYTTDFKLYNREELLKYKGTVISIKPWKPYKDVYMVGIKPEINITNWTWSRNTIADTYLELDIEYDSPLCSKCGGLRKQIPLFTGLTLICPECDK